MASTSLADQLRRLAAPQTALLVHSKRKASLLFDAKEAANFDRDTFYELGLSGLEELVKLHPQFKSFEATLFDVTSRSLERAVESEKINEKLNKEIRKFMYLLSPYFLLKSSQKAIEWLINRYHIHQFNIEELMLLALPYHETMLFARVVQLLLINNQTHAWHWLYPLQKAGVPLSKTAILNRAASDPSFLKLICSMPREAIRVHNTVDGAASLSTLFAFYCTTVTGALEMAPTITEVHVMHILPSLLDGLTSKEPNFISASMIILARLMTKIQLTTRIFHELFYTVTKVNIAQLKTEVALLLVLMTQSDNEECGIPVRAVIHLVKQPWFLPQLATLYASGVVITHLVAALLTQLFVMIQSPMEKNDCTICRATEANKDDLTNWVTQLFTQIHLDITDAKIVFRLILDSYKPGVVDEWYSSLLRDLERRYPEAFDSVTTALFENKSELSKKLKKLLGFKMPRSVLFEQLLHPNAEIRAMAVNNVAKQLESSQIAWLADSIAERLLDESAAVVHAMLSLPATILSASLAHDQLIVRLAHVCTKVWHSDDTDWQSLAPNALHHLCSLNIPEQQSPLVLLTILPFLLDPSCKATTPTIMNTIFAENNYIMKSIKRNIVVAGGSEQTVETCIRRLLNNSKLALNQDDLADALNQLDQFDKDYKVYRAIAMLLFTHTLPQDASAESVNVVLNCIKDYMSDPKLVACEKAKKYKKKKRRSGATKSYDQLKGGMLTAELAMCKRKKQPVELALHCLAEVAGRAGGPPGLKQAWCDLSAPAHLLLSSIFSLLIQGASLSAKDIAHRFQSELQLFLKDHFGSDDECCVFLLNAASFSESIAVDCLHLVCDRLSPLRDAPTLDCLLPPLLLALSSAQVPTRLAAISLLTTIPAAHSDRPYAVLITQLTQYTEELTIDHEQMSVALYKLLCPDTAVRSLLAKQVQSAMSQALDSLIELITRDTTPPYIAAQLLNLLELVNSQDIMMRLVPTGIKILLSAEQQGPWQLAILHCVLTRINYTVADCVREPQMWLLFEAALANHSLLLPVPTPEDKTKCPAVLLMGQISREVFELVGKDTAERLLSIIVTTSADNESAELSSATASVVKRIVLDASLAVPLLTLMRDASAPMPTLPSGKPRRSIQGAPPSFEVLQTPEWRRGVCLLELIQNKKKLTSVELLPPLLFDIMKKCLAFAEQAPVEYTKQLLLSCLLHCCEKLSPDGSQVVLPERTLQVELVVQCVRASHNPQTHHHALLLLSHIANMIPEQVLHHIMAIFTFIGSSVLRQDDAYSFQIISKIVETIIPVLARSVSGTSFEESVTSVLRVFVTALLDIPDHRRLPLLHKLLITLSEGNHLWIFLGLIFESHVLNPNQEPAVGQSRRGDLSEVSAKPNSLKVSLQLCGQFPPATILQSARQLICYAASLPIEKDAKWMNKKLPRPMLFDVESNTAKQLRHFKYTLLTFLSTLLSSTLFINQVASINENADNSLQDSFRQLVEEILRYIQSVSKQADSSANLPTAKYWRVMLNLCYDLLDKTNAMLPTDSFLAIVGSLLQHQGTALHRKAMDLLNSRLAQARPLPSDALLALMPPIMAAIADLKLAPVTSELLLNQQTALISLKLLSRHLAASHPAPFKQALKLLTGVVVGRESCDPVLASAVLCVGELMANLRAHAIACLPKLMPPLIRLLHSQLEQDSPDVILLGVVTAVYKIVECLPHFLSPYLSMLLVEISLLTTQLTNQTENIKMIPLVQKMKAIRQKLSSELPVRVLVPAVADSFTKLTERAQFAAVTPLMALLSDSFSSSSDLSPELTTFFLSALSFRCSSPSLADSDHVETAVVKALTALTLKLSETVFRPLYYRIYEWAFLSDNSKDKAITFYRLSGSLAESLKGLFVLFAGRFINNASELLEEMHPGNASVGWFDDSAGHAVAKSCQLVDTILKTLLFVFTHDTQHFLNKNRFDAIMQPVVDQLENILGGDEIWSERVETLVTPCIAQMAVSSKDDTHWKLLNYQLLLKTRHNLPQVRKAALLTVCELVRKLGEEFLPLLPETVPFLAELLEDEDEVVEKACQRVVQDMEKILGEPIQKYF